MIEDIKKIASNAKNAFLEKNYEKALDLYLKVIRANLTDIERVGILNYVIELFFLNGEEDAALECMEDYFLLTKDVNIAAADIQKIKSMRKEIHQHQEKRRLQELAKIDKVFDVKAIGFWKSEDEPHFPHPKTFQIEDWNLEERARVIKHLKNGETIRYSRGSSWCRFHCGEKNMGSADLTDGYYLYPEGLVHYLEKHQVKLPQEFITHVLNYQPISSKYNLHLGKIDYQWWLKATVD